MRLLFIFLITCGPLAWNVVATARADGEQEERNSHGSLFAEFERLPLTFKDEEIEKVLSDWLPWSAEAPLPELYYRDLPDGRRQLIWPYESTLPRDVLAGRSKPWLYLCLDIEKDEDILLVHVLEHYSRLGIDRGHMLFTILAGGNKHEYAPSLHRRESTSSSHLDMHTRLQRIEDVLKSFGADYRLLLGEASVRERYRMLLLSLRKIPLRDWVIFVNGNEFLDLGGGQTAEVYFHDRERQGVNWVTGSSVLRVQKDRNFVSKRPSLWTQFPVQCPSGSTNERVVAFRGFLRPDMAGKFAVSAKDAEDYFAKLYHLTPYSAWRHFYKTELTVGNAYLWYDNKAIEQVALIYCFEPMWEGFEIQRYEHCIRESTPQLPPLSKDSALLLSHINYVV
jgi:hypothetical protein